jgi:hypothetical protein
MLFAKDNCLNRIFRGVKLINPNKMKKISKLLFATALSCSFVVFESCKDSQSVIDPTTNGTAASTRPAAAGSGVSTAAVIYSPWITTASWGGRVNAVNYIIHRYQISNIAKLDQAMIDQGAILMYVRLGGTTGEVFPIPFQRIWSRTASVTGLAYEKWSYSATPNQLLITIDPEINGYNPPTDAQVRYVLIPGESGGRKAAIDYNDYEAVKAAYNLAD